MPQALLNMLTQFPLVSFPENDINSFDTCYFSLSACGLVIVKDSVQEVQSEH